MNNSSEKIIAAILSHIPKNVKPVSFLIDSLNISRESAYRRIRGEIPFTFEEIVKLALMLGISIDDTISFDDIERASFDFIAKDNAQSNFNRMLEKISMISDEIVKTEDTESIFALNRFPPVFLAISDALFKFGYYKASQRRNEKSVRETFSEIVLPENFIELQNNIRNNLPYIDPVIIIFDPNVFLSLIMDIEYYYRQKLISNEDLNLLKEEVSNLIRLFENMAQTGVSRYNSKIFIYLSSLFINANTGYIRRDSIEQSFFWFYETNPMAVLNQKLCETQKKWLLSLKRQSMLISQSNEIRQVIFFEKQQEYLKEHLGE